MPEKNDDRFGALIQVGNTYINVSQVAFFQVLNNGKTVRVIFSNLGKSHDVFVEGEEGEIMPLVGWLKGNSEQVIP